VADTPWLNDRHVVFGKVVNNMKLIKSIEKMGSSSGRVSKDVRIAECEVL